MSERNLALFLVPIGLAAALAGYMVSRQLGQTAPIALTSGTALPAPRAVAPFALADHHDRPFGNAELAGRPGLVFFGFTHCPDVCPTTLVMMAQLQRDPALAGLHMIFVTVDPERDDAATLRAYMGAFGGKVTGLRGGDTAIDSLLGSLGAVRARQPLAGGDYTMDHSATLFYLDARGALAAIFSPPFDSAKLKTDLAALLAAAR